MVDTGAQSTIILRDTLHALNRHLRRRGRKLPKLELPTAHLYGKNSVQGGQELVHG
jgi:hypothetical protein